MTTGDTKLDAALSASKIGIRVFPCKENDRTPAIRGWKEKATTDESQIRKWWSRNPEANPACVVDDDRTVVDIDVKKGKKGDETVAGWKLLYDYPDTWTVHSPSGGLHHHFESAPSRNSCEHLGKGVDTRGGGKGYVLLPGATIDGVPYTWDETHNPDAHPAPAKLPLWLYTNLMDGYREREQDTAPAAELDKPTNIARATDYLTSTAPKAVEGDAGDHTTFSVAAKLKDIGVSEPTALELMLDHWNDECSPPWSPEELQTKVANAYAYGVNAPASNAPEADFEPFSLPNETSTRLYYERPSEIRIDTQAAYLVDDWLDEQAMSVMYGPSNVGKTFLMMSISYAIATGSPWFGNPTKQGAVVYVAAEAGSSAKKRIAALKQHHDRQDDFPLYLVPCPVDLLRKNADTKPLIKLVKQIEEDNGYPVRLIVIDTLARAMAGGNENASDDMGALVNNLDRIRVQTDAHLTVVHHSGKDQAKGARGHSSLRAATDTEIEIVDGTVRATKQRDLEGGRPVGFVLKGVELGTRSDGKAITSCVVQEGVSDTGGDFEALNLKPADELALRALRTACLDPERSYTDSEHVCVDTEIWRVVLKELDGETGGKFTEGKSASAWRNRFQEARKNLQKAQNVGVNRRNGWYLLT